MGGLTWQPDGSFVLTPQEGFVGPTSFRYKVGDDLGGVADATVTVTVAANGPPVAAPDSYSAFEGRVLDVRADDGLLANDVDPENDPTTVVLVDTSGLDGTLVVDPDGSFVFTPTPGFIGLTSFRYRAGDSVGAQRTSELVIVTIDVAASVPPEAEADAYSVVEGQVLDVAPGDGVLANDLDPEGQAISVVLVDDAGLDGSLAVNPDGSFVFTPDEGFIGATSFRYRAGDGDRTSELTSVRIDVTRVIAPPCTTEAVVLACNDLYTSGEGEVLAVDANAGLLANDATSGLPLVVAGVSILGDDVAMNPDGSFVVDVSGGQAVLQPDGSFVFTPSGGFRGLTGFEYEVGLFLSGGVIPSGSSAFVGIMVGNDSPIAADDGYTAAVNTTLIVGAPGLLTNDSDLDGDRLTVLSRSVSTAANGSVTVLGNGAFEYSPSRNFSGTDSFTYTVIDGLGGEDTATVTIDVLSAADLRSRLAAEIRDIDGLRLQQQASLTKLLAPVRFPGLQLHRLGLFDLRIGILLRRGVIDTKKAAGLLDLSALLRSALTA